VAPNQNLPTIPEPSDAPTLARRLGLFDITMLVMGSVIGAGIFVVPHDVAKLVHTPALILIAWVVGGVISVAGSLVYADLSRRRPVVGGQYAFLREAHAANQNTAQIAANVISNPGMRSKSLRDAAMTTPMRAKVATTANQAEVKSRSKHTR